jgi:hypothetical protein
MYQNLISSLSLPIINKLVVMGAKLSIPLHDVFKQELSSLNQLVTSILTEENVFRNSNYNFLSHNVCAKHTIVLEEELGRHLKIRLQTLGTGLYLIPTADTATTSQGKRISKRDICSKISNHYMRILYVLTLIKYVYDLEHHGDYSIAGIIFRNIKVNDGLMSITHCSMPQKDFSHNTKDNKIDFGTLEGMSFFVNYVMDKDEGKAFVDVLKAILSRSPRGEVRKTVCSMLAQKKLNVTLVRQVEQTFKDKYGSELQCANTSTTLTQEQQLQSLVNRKIPNLFMRVERNNPVFLKDYCYNVNDVIVRLDNANNKVVLSTFKKMQQNYKNNVSSIERLMDKLVIKTSSGQYELRDIGKPELDIIVEDVKSTVKLFYIQSILDFQNLLDIAKNNQNIEVNREQ